MEISHYLTALPWGLQFAGLNLVLIATVCTVVGTRGQKWHPVARNALISLAVLMLLGMVFGIALQGAIDNLIKLDGLAPTVQA